MGTHTIELGPGQKGFEYSSDGVILSVKEGSNPHRKGVKVGMQMVKVDQGPFTSERLEEARDGDERYEITFTYQAGNGPETVVASFAKQASKGQALDRAETNRRCSIGPVLLADLLPPPDADFDFESSSNAEPEFMSAKIVRVFRFTTRREARVLEIRKKKNVWYILVDGTLARTAAYGTPKDIEAWHAKGFRKDTPKEVDGVSIFAFGIAEFSEEAEIEDVASRSGGTLEGKAYIRWSQRERRFIYAVTVEAIAIPAMWSDRGKMQFSSYIPDVVDVERNLYIKDEINRGNSDWLTMFRDDLPAYSTTRIWRLILNGELRGIEVSYLDNTFIIFADGIEVKTLDLSKEVKAFDRWKAGWTLGCKVDLRVHGDAATFLAAFLRIHWSSMARRFDYDLMIGSRYIPLCGFKGSHNAPSEFFSIEVPDITPQLTTLPVTEMTAQKTGKQSNVEASGDWVYKDWTQSQLEASDDQPLSPFLTERMYYFTTGFKLRTVSIVRHSRGWTFISDGLNVCEVKRNGRHRRGFCACCASEERHIATFEIPVDQLDYSSVGATCEILWAYPSGWRYTLEILVNHERHISLIPLYGPEGCGQILEIIDTDKVGLDALRRLSQQEGSRKSSVVSWTHVTGSALLVKDVAPDESQIQVEKEYVSEFVVGGCIKIEGPSDVDPQEFRTIVGTAPTGVITLDIPLEFDHDRGATVKKVRKEDMVSKESTMEEKCQAALDHIMKKLRVHDKHYGIRFFSGEVRLGFESILAVTVDIAQLLKKFPFFHVKITGYSSAPSADDLFKTDEDVFYLALKRCEVIKQLLLDKGVKNLIGIEGKGFLPDMPPCCLIQRSDEKEIRKCNETAEKFFAKRAQSTDPRYVIKSAFDSPQSNQLALMAADAGIKATKAMDFNQQETRAEKKLMEESSHGQAMAEVDVDLWNADPSDPLLAGKELKKGKQQPKAREQRPSEELSALGARIKELEAEVLEKSMKKLEAEALEIEALQRAQALWTMKNGYIPDGDDVYVGMMTVHEAKMKSERLVGCQGFCHAGPPTDSPVVIYFKAKSQLVFRSDVEPWTTYLRPQAATGTVEDSTEKVMAKHQLERLQSYMPGEEVEYFSRTNKRWLSALVTNVTFELGEDETRVFYDLIFSRSRSERAMAELHSIRKPLGQDGVRTLVEVFSKRNNGTWLPGYIDGFQQSATTTGYSVMVKLESSNDEQLFENVPCERIRRRFESGTAILFYVNAKFGWKPAVIAPEASNGCFSRSGEGVRELAWLGIDEHESSKLRIIGDTRRYHMPSVVLVGQPAVALAIDDLPPEGKKAKDTSGEDKTIDPSAGLEPWTLLPIWLDKGVTKEINQDRKLWVELWRVRSLNVGTSMKENPLIVGLDGNFIIDRGGIPRRIFNM